MLRVFSSLLKTAVLKPITTKFPPLTTAILFRFAKSKKGSSNMMSLSQIFSMQNERHWKLALQDISQLNHQNREQCLKTLITNLRSKDISLSILDLDACQRLLKRHPYFLFEAMQIKLSQISKLQYQLSYPSSQVEDIERMINKQAEKCYQLCFEVSSELSDQYWLQKVEIFEEYSVFKARFIDKDDVDGSMIVIKQAQSSAKKALAIMSKIAEKEVKSYEEALTQQQDEDYQQKIKETQQTLSVILMRNDTVHSNMFNLMITEIQIQQKEPFQVVELEGAEQMIRSFKKNHEYLEKLQKILDTSDVDIYQSSYDLIRCQYWQKISIFKKVTKSPQLFKIYDAVIVKDYLSKSQKIYNAAKEELIKMQEGQDTAESIMVFVIIFLLKVKKQILSVQISDAQTLKKAMKKETMEILDLVYEEETKDNLRKVLEQQYGEESQIQELENEAKK